MAVRARKRNPSDLSAKVVFGYLAIIDRSLPKVRTNTGGLEPLHQLRVTLRRLRNAFWVYKKYLPETLINRWKASLESASVYSGEARDLDVQMLFLTEYQKKLKKKEAKFLDAVVKRIGVRRARLQTKLSSSLGQLQRRKTLVQIKTYFRTHRIGDRARFKRIAERRINKRMAQLLAFDNVVAQPSKVADLHQMRIAAKHLRYTLESFRPLYGKPVERYIADVIVIQRALGVVHDMDVWLAGKQGKGVKGFEAFCRHERQAAYRKLVGVWKEYRRTRLWNKLRNFITR